jgi:hypothetical protein
MANFQILTISIFLIWIWSNYICFFWYYIHIKTQVNRNFSTSTFLLFDPSNYKNTKQIKTRYDYNLTIMKSPKLATDTIYPHIKFWWYRTMLNFYAVFWQPFWKWQTSWKFWKRRIAPLMVTYHYVKFYVSIIIQLEVININVQNFKFPIGFYSNPHPLWTPKNMALTPFTTNLKTLGSTRNIYL